MTEKDFRQLRRLELQEGTAIWLQGKTFIEPPNFGILSTDENRRPVCGPFLIERILFQTKPEPTVDIVDPATGDRRSMLCSWLLVPKENENER